MPDNDVDHHERSHGAHKESASDSSSDEAALAAARAVLSKEALYRVEGYIRLPTGSRIPTRTHGHFESVDYSF